MSIKNISLDLDYVKDQFPAFKDGLNNFYSTYMCQEYTIKEPLRYPSVYGLN